MVELDGYRWRVHTGMAVMACACLLANSPAQAQSGRTAAASATAGAQIMACVQQAAQRYGISNDLLLAMARHESGLNPHAINRANANGSVDVGLLQINSGWFASLARYGITPVMLWEPCTNAMVGAWILAQNIQRHGYTWKAVGAYNAASPDKQQAYVQRIYGVLNSQTVLSSGASKLHSRASQPPQIQSGRQPGQMAAAEFPAGLGDVNE